jgi:uncharacterized protein with HEPN domain
MPPEIQKHLSDILQAIQDIESYFPNGYNFYDYQANKMLRRAVERELEIIGEAMNRALKLFPDLNIPEAKRVIALRNRVIHGYDSVDDILVWAVVVNHLIPLREKIVILVNSQG